MPKVSPVIREAAGVLFPQSCAGCGMKNESLCQECVESLYNNYRSGLRADVPGPRTRTLDSGCEVFSSLEYSGICANVIVQFKRYGNLALARHLRGYLSEAIAGAANHVLGEVAKDIKIELCPVPSTRTANWRRGFNPICTLLSVSGFKVSQVLRHSGNESQKKLNHKQRRLNAIDSITATRMLQGRCFILVDDVVTSGATLTSAMAAIQKARGTVLACATLATTLKNFPPPSSRDLFSYPD